MCRTYLAECLGPQHRRIFTPNTEVSTLGRSMSAYSPQYTNSAEQRLCRKYQVSPPPLVLPVDTSPLPPPASTGTRAGSTVCGTTLVPIHPRRRKWHFCVAGAFKSVLDVSFSSSPSSRSLSSSSLAASGVSLYSSPERVASGFPVLLFSSSSYAGSQWWGEVDKGGTRC